MSYGLWGAWKDIRGSCVMGGCQAGRESTSTFVVLVGGASWHLGYDTLEQHWRNILYYIL